MVKSERNLQCDETVILRVLLWRLKRGNLFFSGQCVAGEP